MNALIHAWQDWLSLLQGPNTTNFVPGPGYPMDKDWRRLVTLIGLCTALSATVSIVVLGGAGDVTFSSLKATAQTLLITLLAGAVVATPYVFIFARLCGVHIAIDKATHVFLLFGLPWIPLVMLVRALALAHPHVLPLALGFVVCSYLAVVTVCINVGRALSLVLPSCSRLRVVSSVSLALLSATSLVVYWFL